jgi:redox-sensitive bicupin YhaK (pirin superfamily)
LSWTGPLTATAVPSDTPAVELILEAQTRYIDSLTVARVLPSVGRRLVGPFAFFDHFGPARLLPGEGLDVRPHPHINLATVTYLFEGEILHRDSLGSRQLIQPGAINWMTAGSGIVHSERTPVELRHTGSNLHGIQLWVGLPREKEETEPAFFHHPADALPVLERGDGTRLRLLVGSAFGLTSPVAVLSPMVYAEVMLPAGGRLELPPEHRERAVYVVEGVVACGQELGERGRMLVFAEGGIPVVQAEAPSRVMLIGGAPLDGPRTIWWNFVSSSRERIEKAKADWREGRFPRVPGDEAEIIPLPE